MTPEALQRWHEDRVPQLAGLLEGSQFFPNKLTQVVSGKARGWDTVGEVWARQAGIQVKPFPAYWEQYGRRAGFMRNAEMAAQADALLAIWDGRSKGTRNMIEEASLQGLDIEIALTRWDMAWMRRWRSKLHARVRPFEEGA
jgi:hypothetical protein